MGRDSFEKREVLGPLLTRQRSFASLVPFQLSIPPKNTGASDFGKCEEARALGGARLPNYCGVGRANSVWTRYLGWRWHACTALWAMRQVNFRDFSSWLSSSHDAAAAATLYSTACVMVRFYAVRRKGINTTQTYQWALTLAPNCTRNGVNSHVTRSQRT